MNLPVKVDPEFGGPPSDLAAKRSGRAYRSLRVDKVMDQTILSKAREHVDAQLSEVPTPITDELGSYKKAPVEAEFWKKVEKVADEYGVSYGVVAGYINNTAFPGGRSGHQNWDGGYGMNALGALQRFEKQANFFKLHGVTPSEAVEAKYDELSSMKKRETEVASALGWQPPRPTYEQRLAKLEEEEKKLMTLPQHTRNPILMSIQNQKKYLREEFGRGGKSRRVKKLKSKKSRKTRRFVRK